MNLGNLIRQKGIKSTAKYGAKHNEDFKNCDPWTVTLRYGRRRMTVPFYMGHGHQGAKPDTEAVLECLLLDAICYESAKDFEDFASNLGYDPDSRKAESIYRECGRISRRLRQFLGDDFDLFAYAER